MKKFLIVSLLVFSTNTLAVGVFGNIILPDIVITPRYGYNHQYSPLYFSREPDYYSPQIVYVAPPQPVYVLPPQPAYVPPPTVYYNQAPVYVQPAQEYYENLELRRRYGD